MVCRFFSIGALVLTLGSFAACGGSNGTNATQCKSTSECPSGEVCNQSQCTKTCDSSTVCPGGYSCQNGLCTSGSTGTPEITSIAGLSTETCDSGPCIGTGFSVTGKNFASTSFTLKGPGDDGTSYSMDRTNDGSTDTVATLVPVLKVRQTDLHEGTYTLTAVNASGETSSDVSLLQGEAGPDMTGDELIDRINTASAGKILGKYLDVDTAGSGSSATGTLSIWSNSEASSPTSTATLALRGMQVKVDASTDDVVSKKIDQTTLTTYCGDDDGCEVTLGAVGFHDVSVDDYIINTPLNGGSCRFFWKENGWSLSQDCVVAFQSYAKNSNDEYVESGVYQNYYYANAFGKDGSDTSSAYTCGTKVNKDADGEPLVVMSFKGACYFTEAPADTASGDYTGCLTADTSAGFYLVASHPTWDYQGTDADGNTVSSYPSSGWPEGESGRSCVLTVRD